MSGIFVGVDGWAGGTVVFDPPSPFSNDTYDYDAELGRQVATPYQVASDIVTWFNASGRPWNPTVTCSLSVNATIAAPWLAIDLVFNDGMDNVTPAGGIATNLGWSALGADPLTLEGGAVPSSVACDVGLTNWVLQSDAMGSRCRSGSWAMHGGGNIGDARRPQIVATLAEDEAAALAGALRVASSPRLANVYDTINDAWRLVSLGMVRYRQLGHTHQQAQIRAMG